MGRFKGPLLHYLSKPQTKIPENLFFFKCSHPRKPMLYKYLPLIFLDCRIESIKNSFEKSSEICFPAVKSSGKGIKYREFYDSQPESGISTINKRKNTLSLC